MTWLTTADHKRVGRMYVVASLGFLLIAGLVGGVLRAGLDVSDSTYLRIVDLHSTAAAVLVLAPLWLGLATYLVPLQIGAARLAFPRLQSFAFWTYVLGGALHLASYLGNGPRVAGLGFSRMIDVPTGGKAATDLWIASLAIVTIAGLLASVNLLTTILTRRAEGLTLARAPMFTWATLVSSAGTLLAAPVFVAGLLLLYLDQHFGGAGFFSVGTVGTQVVWQHTLWLYGSPAIYLLLVPGLGAASDIVARAAGRELVDTRAARAAIAALAFLGFGAWAAGTKVAGAIVLPSYSPLTAATGIPIAVLILLWLDTLRRGGRPKFDAGVVFVLGFIVVEGAGLAAEVVAAAKPVDGTVWSSGHVHLIVFSASLLLAVGAMHNWAAKVWGRSMSQSAAMVQFLLIVGGSAMFALGSYVAGYKHVMRGVRVDNAQSLQFAALGGLVLALGVLAVLVDVVSRTLRPGASEDPDGLTLEWATSSPPPPHNFDTLPEIRSATPHADLHPVGAGS